MQYQQQQGYQQPQSGGYQDQQGYYQQQPQAGGYQEPPQSYQQPQMQAHQQEGYQFGQRVAKGSNAYANGSNQNCGNFLTDRPTSRVLAPPGGGSSFSIGWDTSENPHKKENRNVNPTPGFSAEDYKQSSRYGGDRTNRNASSISFKDYDPNSNSQIEPYQTQRGGQRAQAPYQPQIQGQFGQQQAPPQQQQYRAQVQGQFGEPQAQQPKSQYQAQGQGQFGEPQTQQYQAQRQGQFGGPQQQYQQPPTTQYQQQAPATQYGGEPTFGQRVAKGSNAYANGSNQNCGNFLTDRPTSRVLAPPGGKSSFSLG